MDADFLGVNEAAEIFLLRHRPIPVAGGEAPGGLLSHLVGISIDQGIHLVRQVLCGCGGGGVQEQAPEVVAIFEMRRRGLLDVIAHRDRQHCHRPSGLEVALDGAAFQGERHIS